MTLYNLIGQVVHPIAGVIIEDSVNQGKTLGQRVKNLLTDKLHLAGIAMSIFPDIDFALMYGYNLAESLGYNNEYIHEVIQHRSPITHSIFGIGIAALLGYGIYKFYGNNPRKGASIFGIQAVMHNVLDMCNGPVDLIPGLLSINLKTSMINALEQVNIYTSESQATNILTITTLATLALTYAGYKKYLSTE